MVLYAAIIPQQDAIDAIPSVTKYSSRYSYACMQSELGSNVDAAGGSWMFSSFLSNSTAPHTLARGSERRREKHEFVSLKRAQNEWEK